MVEYNSLMMLVGYDLLQYEDNKIAYTLGRHTNDYMTSFYSITPSGLLKMAGVEELLILIHGSNRNF